MAKSFPDEIELETIKGINEHFICFCSENQRFSGRTNFYRAHLVRIWNVCNRLSNVTVPEKYWRPLTSCNKL